MRVLLHQLIFSHFSSLGFGLDSDSMLARLPSVIKARLSQDAFRVETTSRPNLKFLFTVAEAAQSAVLESCQAKLISLSKTKVLDLHLDISIGICSLLNSLLPFVFFLVRSIWSWPFDLWMCYEVFISVVDRLSPSTKGMRNILWSEEVKKSSGNRTDWKTFFDRILKHVRSNLRIKALVIITGRWYVIFLSYFFRESSLFCTTHNQAHNTVLDNMLTPTKRKSNFWNDI